MPRVTCVCFALICLSAARLLAGDLLRLDDYGADDTVFLSLPAIQPKAAVLLVPDAMADPAVVASRCDLLARLGYIAAAVDFYNGRVAEDQAEAAQIQKQLLPKTSLQTLKAAGKLLCQSPRYRTEKLVLAVWGDNLSLVLQALQDPVTAAHVQVLTWMEPTGRLQPGELATLPAGVLILYDRKLETSNFNDYLAALKNSRGAAAEFYPLACEPGYLMKGKDSEATADAWSSVIKYWQSVLQGQSPAANATHGAFSPEAPLTPSPAASMRFKR